MGLGMASVSSPAPHCHVARNAPRQFTDGPRVKTYRRRVRSGSREDGSFVVRNTHTVGSSAAYVADQIL